MCAARLSAEARRISIIQAAIPVFAKLGFKGTTTKALAEAAGVSEALLYRHFPSKDDLYTEIQGFVCQDKDRFIDMVARLKPSTSTLVHCIYYLISIIFEGDPGEDQRGVEHQDVNRIMIKSFLESGNFAKSFIDRNINIWEGVLVDCLRAAQESGDIIDDWLPEEACIWFSHHLAVAAALVNLPQQQIINYRFPIETLTDKAVRFCLRGMGLTDKAIETHYNPALHELYGLGGSSN